MYYWGEWELQREFDSWAAAKTYGDESLYENHWRITNHTNDVVFEHNPVLLDLERTANEDLQRFSRLDSWMARGRPQYRPRPPRQPTYPNPFFDPSPSSKDFEYVNWLEDGF